AHHRHAGSDIPGVRAFVAAVAAGPQHAVAQDDQKLVPIEGFGVEHLDFVAEVDGESGIGAQRFAQAGADVIAIVIAVADERERGGFVPSEQPRAQNERRQGTGGNGGAPRDHKSSRYVNRNEYTPESWFDCGTITPDLPSRTAIRGCCNRTYGVYRCPCCSG